MKISKRITAFMCAGIMTIGLSSAAFADSNGKEDTGIREKPEFSGAMSSENHHSSHRRHKPERHSRNRSYEEYSEQAPASEYDEMQPEGECGMKPQDRWNEDNTDLDEYSMFPDDYTLPESIYTDGYGLAPWYSEDDSVEEPAAVFPEEPEEKIAAPKEKLPDEELPGPDTDIIASSIEEENTTLPIDLNDEAAMQELFQEFMQWLKDNYTVPADKTP